MVPAQGGGACAGAYSVGVTIFRPLSLVPFLLALAGCGTGCGGAEPNPQTPEARSLEAAETPAAETEAPIEAATQTRPTGVVDPDAVTAIPAINAVLLGDRILVQERTPEGAPMRFSARDVFTDEVFWTRTFPETDMFMQRFDAHHVLLQPVGTLRLLDVRDGTHRDHPRDRGLGRFLHRNGEAVLLTHECGAQVIDAEDARPIAALRTGRAIRMRMINGEGHSHHQPACNGHVVPLGRSGDQLHFYVENHADGPATTAARPPFNTGVDVVLGMNRQTGDIAWQTEVQCTACGSHRAGVLDGTVWVTTEDGVSIFEAATGGLLRTVPLPETRVVFMVPGDPPLLELLSATQVKLVEVRTGRVRFDRPVQDEALVVVQGATYTTLADVHLRAYQPRRAEFVDLQGRTTRTLDMPENSSLLEPSPGAPWVAARGFVSRDNSGQMVPFVDDGARFNVHRTRVPETPRGPPNHARVECSSCAQTDVAEVSMDAWSLGEARRGDVHALVLFAHAEDWRAEDEVRIFRVPRAVVP